MFALQPWLTICAAAIGNCGFWLFCFNRVNAFGYPRPVAKTLEKLCIAACFAIPICIFYLNWQQVLTWLTNGTWLPSPSSISLSFWLASSLLSIVILGPLWIESRLWLIEPEHALSCQTELHHVHRLIPGGSAQNLSTKLLALVPLNELSHLSVTRKTLKLPRNLPSAEGLKIGHLSDLHFTGQYRSEHYNFVVQQMMDLSADLIIISGDIIDYAHCLPVVQPVLSQLSAPLGVYFVLGNHDRRLRDISRLVNDLCAIGFHDLGAEDKRVQRGPLTIELLGNERPWFERHRPAQQHGNVSVKQSTPDKTLARTTVAGAPCETACEQTLRIGVAHTPDRIGWARREGLDLMLAGHTHGGQARFPFIGPLVAPSLYGSKFASGVFWLDPTLMHVSRGVAGTHPLRWRCPPEISLLTLVNQSTG